MTSCLLIVKFRSQQERSTERFLADRYQIEIGAALFDGLIEQDPVATMTETWAPES